MFQNLLIWINLTIWKQAIYVYWQFKLYIKYIYNIGVLTVNIEFMWGGLERGKRALEGLSPIYKPHHINSIFTINTPILYLSCNKICNFIFI